MNSIFFRLSALIVVLAVLQGCQSEMPTTSRSSGADQSPPLSLQRPTGGSLFYVVSSLGDLWTVDVSSGTAALVGPTGFSFVTDIAFSPSGALFGTTGYDLIRIDPLTGAGSVVGPHGSLPGLVVGLDFSSDGVLYGSTQAGGAIITINTITGAGQVMTTTPYVGLGDLAVAGNGTLFGTFVLTQLVQIDPVTWTTTFVGTVPPMSTMDFDPLTGTLFGISNGTPENLVRIDPLTGASTVVAGPLPFNNYGGSFMTSIPVLIDVDPKSINCQNGNGILRVAILSSVDFAATTVDHRTVRFGRGGVEASETHTHNESGELQRHEEDVDADGDVDLVIHFRLRDTGISCGDVLATLTGRTFSGISVRGTDLIRTIGD